MKKGLLLISLLFISLTSCVAYQPNQMAPLPPPDPYESYIGARYSVIYVERVPLLVSMDSPFVVHLSEPRNFVIVSKHHRNYYDGGGRTFFRIRLDSGEHFFIPGSYFHPTHSELITPSARDLRFRGHHMSPSEYAYGVLDGRHRYDNRYDNRHETRAEREARLREEERLRVLEAKKEERRAEIREKRDDIRAERKERMDERREEIMEIREEKRENYAALQEKKKEEAARARDEWLAKRENIKTERNTERERKRLIAAQPWPAKIKRLVAQKRLALGMTPGQAELSWGKARSVRGGGDSFEWIYRNGRISFANKKIASWKGVGN